MSRWIVAVVTAATLAAGGCNRPAAKDCEAAIRTWFTLIFWEDAEKEIAAAPPEQRDALRADKLADRDACMEAGMSLAVSQCRAASDTTFIKCMKSVHTAAQARACRPAKNAAPCSRAALKAQGFDIK
jgi:hypothetical protein